VFTVVYGGSPRKLRKSPATAAERFRCPPRRTVHRRDQERATIEKEDRETSNNGEDQAMNHTLKTFLTIAILVCAAAATGCSAIPKVGGW